MSDDDEEKSRVECVCGDCCGASASGVSDESERRYVHENAGWIESRVETTSGPVPIVSTRLNWRDRLGALTVRMGIRRMSYAVRPGLYAVGRPGPDSPVFVSANYKLSFDRLRKELGCAGAWILVLDTDGINVWCAAGKGAFGTEEIINRLEATGLQRIVAHRTLILPQLGAPGVAAHEVTKRSGFKVVYGPVRASDIEFFLRDGMKASEEMRKVRFNLADRLILTPLELAMTLRLAGAAVMILFVLNLLGLHAFSWRTLYPYLGAILVGCVGVPALLPWIPGPAFAWKGWLLGMAWALIVNIEQGLVFSGSAVWTQAWPRAASHFLLLPAISAFLAMNFTGSSTYTSLSGVVREMKTAVPAILVSAGAGIVLLIAGLAGVF
ncbi:MAG: acetyl-CoA synthase subunit gamma [Candidatus Aminicenantes bacterium]|nr:acetyl-CoA synthase subunit gamma [Candidatus Aminicenantes bacterium]